MIDWIRDSDGSPKRMKTGGYVLLKDGGICFGVKPDDIEDLMELLTQLEEAINVNQCD